MRFNGKTPSQQRPNIHAWSAALATALLLAACGGGGEASPTTDVKTGSFLDAAVQGLTYETATQSGTTDATGQFKYKDGETVTFKLYGSVLSASVGYNVLTPGDTGVEETDLDAIVNQLRFLQTIDTDANPANGINLPTFSGDFAVNFKQSIENFETDAAVTAFLAENASGQALVSVQSAVEHFNGTVQGVTDTTPVLNLSGKTLRQVHTDSLCENEVEAIATLEFGATSVVFKGTDGFQNSNGTCTPSPDETETFEYSDPELAGEPLLACATGPCSYKEANGLEYGLDSDGRTVIELFWHTPGSKKISLIKRVLIDPEFDYRATFKDTLTWE
jgi:hypothetical protein